MTNPQYVYVIRTADKYELPVLVTDFLWDVCRFLGYDTKYLSNALCGQHPIAFVPLKGYYLYRYDFDYLYSDQQAPTLLDPWDDEKPE